MHQQAFDAPHVEVAIADTCDLLASTTETWDVIIAIAEMTLHVRLAHTLQTVSPHVRSYSCHVATFGSPWGFLLASPQPLSHHPDPATAGTPLSRNAHQSPALHRRRNPAGPAANAPPPPGRDRGRNPNLHPANTSRICQTCRAIAQPGPAKLTRWVHCPPAQLTRFVTAIAAPFGKASTVRESNRCRTNCRV